MNRPFLAAGILALVAVPAHIFGGEYILARVAAELFPTIPQGGPDVAKQVLRFGWHMVTVDMLVAGVALLWLARAKSSWTSVALLLGAQWAGWGIVIFVLPAITLGRWGALINVLPQGLLCVVVAGLIGWGIQSQRRAMRR